MIYSPTILKGNYTFPFAFTVKSRYETVQFARDVFHFLCRYDPPKKIILLSGELGTGKTVFSQAIGKEFGITDVINSPSFNIYNQYQNKKNEILTHFDLYRLQENDLFELGIDELIDESSIFICEWWNRSGNFFADYYELSLFIELKFPINKTLSNIEDDESREITINDNPEQI
jgi:tRNA threonylcarbamoyladenosine biosynthesis protein TsaE